MKSLSNSLDKKEEASSVEDHSSLLKWAEAQEAAVVMEEALEAVAQAPEWNKWKTSLQTLMLLSLTSPQFLNSIEGRKYGQYSFTSQTKKRAKIGKMSTSNLQKKLTAF